MEIPSVLPSILIVDDDEAVTQTFARMLELEGYAVRTAGNAESGLKQAREYLPDAIILDLRMPLMDGLGFLRRLRACVGQETTPVAIVTGDYFLDDNVSAELRQLEAERSCKPRWRADLGGPPRMIMTFRVTHGPTPDPDSSKPGYSTPSPAPRSGSCARSDDTCANTALSASDI